MTMSADRSRDEILDAAITAVGDGGFDAATMRGIAKAAGCTTGRVTHYFHSKDELLIAALAKLRVSAARLFASRIKDLSGLAALRELLITTIPANDELRAHWRVWISLWNEGAQQFASQEWDLRAREYEAMVADLLLDAQKDGEVPPDLDIGDTTRLLCAMIYGAGMDATIRPDRYPVDVVERIVAKALLTCRPVKCD
jgi:AcrR family transcriptional regulator